MSVTFERSGASLKHVQRCEDCNEYASHGEGVNMTQAIARKDPKLAGRWWCGQISGVMQCVNKENG